MSLTKEIQSIICKAEIQKGNLVAENVNYLFAGELDVCSVSKAGYVHEFEVKVSRADFKADAKKRKWHYYDYAHEASKQAWFIKAPNYFTYVCPEGMIKPEELKPWQGLIYLLPDNSIQVVKKSTIIHKVKFDLPKLLTKMLTVNNWHHYYGAQKLTILNREIQARNDEQAKKNMAQAFNAIHQRNNNPKACFLQCVDCKKCELENV